MSNMHVVYYRKNFPVFYASYVLQFFEHLSFLIEVHNIRIRRTNKQRNCAVILVFVKALNIELLENEFN